MFVSAPMVLPAVAGWADNLAAMHAFRWRPTPIPPRAALTLALGLGATRWEVHPGTRG